MDPRRKNAELATQADAIAAAVKGLDGDPIAHMALLRQIDNLRSMLETPFDTILKQWGNSSVTAAMNLLVEMDVLQKIPMDGSISTKELADLVDLDESVIARALRLAAMHRIFEETAPDTFAHNDKSRAFLSGGLVEFFRIHVEHIRPYLKLPEYFKSHKKDDLFDLKKSPFAYAVGLEGLTYYEAISHNPDRLNMFNMTMTQMEQQIPTLGMFPFASIKAQVELEPERPFIVDIGGGRGHTILEIQREAPAGFGAKMILQDRPDVIESLSPEDIPDVEKMAYDFFTPQPIKNAHIYILRRILHDFYTPVCISILKIVATAMGPTSRLLIADMIMPEKTEIEGDAMIYWMDFSMMMLNGTEKSVEEFENIIDAAGLELVKIWKSGFGTQAQIECRLKAH